MKKLIVVIFLLAVNLHLPAENLKVLFTKAEAFEDAGDKSTDFEERNTAYNEALTIYYSAEKTVESPSLNRAISRIFFKLQEYPWTILYSQRALKLGENYSSVKSNLETSQAILGIEPGRVSGQFSDYQLSLEAKYALFFWGTIASFLLFCLIIWSAFLYKWQKNIAWIVVLANSLLLINIALSYYFTPLEAIMVSDTGFYRTATKKSSQITLEPLYAGQTIWVIEEADRGEWLKIINKEGLIGYIPSSTTRII